MVKKIDIITKYFIPVVAGIEVNILKTYSVLAQKGWDITIHTSKNTYLEKDILPDSEIYCGLTVRRYHWHWWGIKPHIDWKNTSLVALHNFDIFPHFQLLILSLWHRISGQKKYGLVLTPHGGYNPEWTIFSPLKAWLKKTYTYTLGTWLINQAVDAVRAVSEWEKEEMIKKGLRSDIVHVISNGLEDEAFFQNNKMLSREIKSKVKKWGKYIFEDARVYGIKNYETIIKALPLIPSDINLVSIGMIGNAQYKDNLIKLAKELGVEKRVIFAGIVRGADKYYINRHAQMFVHMAKWESFCNVVHQAISQGLVCIVANNTALPYLVKDGINGFLVDTYDHKQLAEKINFVLDPKNNKLISTIKKYNIEHGRENSWQNVAQKMHNLYSQYL